MKPSANRVVIAALMPHAPVLVPAIGGNRGNRALASVTAMTEVARRVVRSGAETVVLISPHTPRRIGSFAVWGVARVYGSLGQFGAPKVDVDLPADLQLAEAIMTEAGTRGVRTWWLRDSELDHGAIVPLWHLADAGWSGPVVVIGLNYPGETGLRELGEAIAAAARVTQRRVAVIASGDMSHCLQPGAPAGFHPRAKAFDQEFIRRLEQGSYNTLPDFDADLKDLAAEDAVDSTIVAASAVGWSAAGHTVLSYEGPFGVGYGVAILHEADGKTESRASGEGLQAADASAEIVLPEIARRSVEAALRGGDDPEPSASWEGIAGRKGAVFVTIRDHRGKLRGCVGTLTPKFPNAAIETWYVARDAAFRERRFPPVQPEELEHLRFEVSVLTPMEEVTTKTALDARRYGVVVSTADGRRGVLLPDIEGISTVEQQLSLARRKGGIVGTEPVHLQRFEVKKFCEAR